MKNLANYLLQMQKESTVRMKPITDEWVKDVTDIHSSTFNRLKKGENQTLAYYLQWSRFYQYTDQGRDPRRMAFFTYGLWIAACSCLEETWNGDRARHMDHVRAMLAKLEAEKQQLSELSPDDPRHERLAQRIRQHEWKTDAFFRAQKSKN